MNEIAIYVEGGGDSAGTKAAIRRGLDELLGSVKQKARDSGWRWRVVACGGRREARDAFMHARATQPDVHTILLDDSETAVAAQPIAHLTAEGWELAEVSPAVIHLMTQVMETWLIADPDALSKYYGRGFRASALPGSAELETVPKTKVLTSLQRATRDTQKGPYHKIRHAEHLLGRVSASRVRGRCPHAERLFSHLDSIIQ